MHNVGSYMELTLSLRALSVFTKMESVIYMFLVSDCKGGLNAPKYVLFEFFMQKLRGSEVLLVDDLKSTWECDVHVVDILKLVLYF
jgi:hypothetical protein